MPLMKKRLFAAMMSALCMLMLLMPMLSQGAFAAESKNLTLVCKKDDVVLADMEWRIFRVGQRAAGGFVLTGDFADYQIDLQDMSVENIGIAAKTLESYVIADDISPLREGKTASNGELRFENLGSGLYLALGKKLEIAPYTYEPSPLLMEVGQAEDSFRFDAYPKIIRVNNSEQSMRYTVKKVWIDDDNFLAARPTSVTVDLFKDEVLYDTVTLSEANNWTYQWENLGKRAAWRVAEREIPVDYEVRIEYNETQFLIRNRYQGQTVVTDTTAITEDTTSEGSTDTTTETTATGVTDTNPPPADTTALLPPPSEEKIPQTGQLWWPVLLLGLSGTVMVVVGFLVRPKKDET